MKNKAGVAVIPVLLATTTAWAGPQFEAQLSRCTGTNCAGTTMRGIHQKDEPFVIQVFGKAGECLRLDVSSQTEDMAMVLISPSVWDGIISDDRDFDGGDVRPLITVDPVPWTGWYTVMVSYYDHLSIDGRFVLEYGRYPTGSPNCVAAPVLNSGEFGQQSKYLGGFSLRAEKAIKSGAN